MAKTKEQKEKILKNLEDLFKKAKSVVMIDYYGLKVKEINQLRKLLKEVGCNYLVVKKTLLNRALAELGFKDINLDKLTGGLGLIFGLEDEIAPAKLITQFSKDHEKMRIHGGFFNQKFIETSTVKALAKLPTRDQLRAQIVWLIKSPLTGLVNVLHGNLRNLVYVLEAIKNKK